MSSHKLDFFIYREAEYGVIDCCLGWDSKPHLDHLYGQGMEGECCENAFSLSH